MIAAGDRAAMSRIEANLVGEPEPVEELLMSRKLIAREGGSIHLTNLSRLMAEHFIGVERLTRIMDLVRETKDPLEILAELDCATDEEAALLQRQLARKEELRNPRPEKGKRGHSRKRR